MRILVFVVSVMVSFGVLYAFLCIHFFGLILIFVGLCILSDNMEWRVQPPVLLLCLRSFVLLSNCDWVDLVAGSTFLERSLAKATSFHLFKGFDATSAVGWTVSFGVWGYSLFFARSESIPDLVLVTLATFSVCCFILLCSFPSAVIFSVFGFLFPSLWPTFLLLEHFCPITIVIFRAFSLPNSFLYCQFCLFCVFEGILFVCVARLVISSGPLLPLFFLVVFVCSLLLVLCSWFVVNSTDGARYGFSWGAGRCAALPRFQFIVCMFRYGLSEHYHICG